LISCSIVGYLFLLIPTLIICRHFENPWLKATFFTLIMLPVNDYNFLIFIGHPYAAQYFCGTITVALFLAIHNRLMNAQAGAISLKNLYMLLLFNFFLL